jgi:hypothetical protein
MHPLKPVFAAYEGGRPALLLSGRPLYDLVADEDGAIRPLVESLRRALRQRYGMAFVRYSLAGGLDWDESGLADERDRRTLSTALRAHRLLDIPQDQNEVARVIRGISSLCRMPASGMRWAEGGEIRLAFLLEFAEHLTPGGMANGTQSDAQVVAIELAHLTAPSLALRSSGNLVLFHGREGMLDDLVCGALYQARLPLASADEKLRFLKAAATVYPKARLEDGLTSESVASLTANTTNRGLEGLLRASHLTGDAVSSVELLAEKSRDAESLSEHTLTALDTRRVANLRLAGRNIAVPARFLALCAAALARSDASVPANILLAGAPATGKTDLALHTAALAKVAAYQWHSPKGGIVGETERKARIQQTVAREWTPNVCFADEITEMLPLQRSEFDGDSGASRSVMAAMLTALSDETRRGKSLLIASTNCVWRMGAAMRSRFEVLPVLQALAVDYAEIIASTAQRVDSASHIDPAADCIREAAEVFYQRGANPRHIRASLSTALLLRGKLTPEAVRFAALNFTGAGDHASSIYADLCAIQSCSSSAFLPWGEDPVNYPFPPHLQGIVDATGGLNQDELQRRINDYREHANV